MEDYTSTVFYLIEREYSMIEANKTNPYRENSDLLTKHEFESGEPGTYSEGANETRRMFIKVMAASVATSGFIYLTYNGAHSLDSCLLLNATFVNATFGLISKCILEPTLSFGGAAASAGLGIYVAAYDRIHGPAQNNG
jgi:hypothetical protein